MRSRRRARFVVAPLLSLTLLAATLAACSDDDPDASDNGDESTEAASSGATPGALELPEMENPEVDSSELDVSESTPVEDSYYPDVGDPGVDSLQHSLDLAWDPETRVLEGTDTLIMRATADADQIQLDLGEPLEVGKVTVDGKEVESTHEGKDLIIEAPVEADERYELVIDYSGTPEPVDAPTTRSDFSTLGWTIGDDGSVWTMQEPFGAYSWYPVNDQPADKALYDFRITVPEGWTGVANGELTDEEVIDGQNVMSWSLNKPASSYLTTIAIGEMDRGEGESESGVPITYWVPAGDTNAMEAMEYAPDAMTWAEERLGDYPFDTLGWVVVDSQSAMETQTMITMGNTDYALSKNVVVHELVHHWYGDIVSPTDWRDVWMNEGMTMYLEGAYEAESTGTTIDEVMDGWAPYAETDRQISGPPGNYKKGAFGQTTIYYGPALMWHELRQRIGDDEFWAMVKKWPTVYPEGNATREQYLTWIEKETGKELTNFFEKWLMAPNQPKRK